MKAEYTRRDFLQRSSGILLGTMWHPLAVMAKARVALVERTAFTMGSIVTIQAYTSDEGRCHLAIDKAFAEMKSIDKLMSVFDGKSQISFINRQGAEKEVRVDERLTELLIKAVHFSVLTGGAFDVTIEPLMELYGFRDDGKGHHFPSDRDIAATLEGVGSHHLLIDRHRSSIALAHEKTAIDPGGIGVGYAIDRAVAILRSYGLDSAIINHSGDVFAIGSPPEENGWEVGIVDPQDTHKIITSVRIIDQALSTSGNYENFIRFDDQTIGHILEPSSGRTASVMCSSTAIAPTAVEADALSTAFFVMGPGRSRSMTSGTNVRCIAVVPDGEERKIIKF